MEEVSNYAFQKEVCRNLELCARFVFFFRSFIMIELDHLAGWILPQFCCCCF